MKDIIINNLKEVAIKNSKWSNPGAKLYNNLLDAMHYDDLENENVKEIINNPNNLNWHDYLKEAYLIAPIKKIHNSPYGVTPYSRSGCKYPHHNIKGNELVLDVNGVRSAYIHAKQMGIFKDEVEKHLMDHIKELELEENLHITDFIKIEENFQFVESFIETFGDEIFTEASHGNLNNSFRLGVNIKNGHRIKIVFDLSKDDVTQIGSKQWNDDGTLENRRIIEPKERKKVISGIKKTGHNDFMSRATVLAIVDMDTNSKLKTVDMLGAMNSFLMNSTVMIGEDIIRKWESYFGRVPKPPFYIKFWQNTMELRELITSSFGWTRQLPKNDIKKFTVGDKEDINGSFKSTKMTKDVWEFMNNVVNQTRTHNTKARGVKKESSNISEIYDDVLLDENFNYIETFIESSKSMENIESINEGYIISKNNLEINLNQWNINDKKLLFITGQAGSGKSSLAKDIAIKHNAIWFGLDFFERTEPDLKNVEDWNKKYKDGDIEYQCIPYILEYYKFRPELLNTWNELMRDESKYHEEFCIFLKWLISRLNKENKLFVVEGVQLAFYADYDKYEDYPLIVMGTSMLKSAFRRIRRAGEKHNIKSAIRNLMISIKKNKMFIDDEKVLDKLRDAASDNIIESTNNDDITKFKEILSMLNGVYYGMYNKKFNKVLYSETKENEINLLDYLDKYGDSEFIIMKPDDVIKYKAGTCWDTSLFIYSKLIENGFNPQMIFYVIESNGSIITHSTVVVKSNNGIYYNIEYSKLSSRGVNKINKISDVYPNNEKLLYVNNDINIKNLLSMNEIQIEDFIKITGWGPTKYIEENAESYEELVPIFGLAKNYISTATKPDGTPIPPSSSQGFSKTIKKLTRGDNYSHALISMDDTFKNMYSFEDEGFVTDNLWTREGWDYTGSIYIAVMFVTPADKAKMQTFINKLTEVQGETEYANVNLIKAFIGKPIKDDKRFVCSSFTGYILSLADSKNVHRDYSRLRPEDVTILPRAFYVMNVENREDFIKRYNEILSRVKNIYEEHKEELLDYNNHLPKLLLKDKMTKLKTIDKIMDWVIAKM